MAKMTDNELLERIKREERTSLDYLAGTLADERAENMELYLGDKTRELSAQEGRSSVVSMDVQEAVESMMPYLMKVFCSGDEVVKFNPKSQEDVKPSEQETDYVNHVIINQNNFYLVANQWFKDSLINKNGYVKFWWDETENVSEEHYEGLTDEELQMLLDDKSVEVIEYESEPAEFNPEIANIIEAAEAGDPQAQQIITSLPKLHEVKVKVTNVKGKVCIEPCPPEEILVSADERSIDPNSVRFFEHRKWVTISDLREMGYKVDDDIPDDSSTLLQSEEWLSRNEFAEEETWRDETQTGANRKVVYREAYVLIDFDGDGITERRQICIVGDTILNNETVDLVPFACITPYIMPHRHVGRALADYVKDIQVIKSVILRNVLDNFYASNNGRWAISDKVNLDDMLVSRPGGVVRVDGTPSAELMPLVSNPIGNAAFPLMEYLDTNKENRTGITRYNQGLDANSLNKTASGINQIMNAAQAKQELIARTFAETGVKQLFAGVHKLLLQHSRQQEIVRLRNEWVPVDPRQWKTRTDMTVAVGLGTGNKQEMLVQIMQILQVQKEALQIGIATPQNIYESCIELTKNAGFKDGDKYWTNPAQQQPKPPQPDPKVVEAQMKAQESQQRLEFDKQKAMADFQQAQEKMQMEFAMKEQQIQNDMQLSRDEMIKEIALAREKMEQEIQIHREKVYAELDIERQRLGLQEIGMAVKAQQGIEGGLSVDPQPPNEISELKEMVAQLVSTVSEMKRPKKVVRDKSGKITGVE